MKTILIIILSMALAGAAFMTRPLKREFVLYILDTQVGRGASGGAAVDQAERQAKDLTIKDCYLWTEAQREGRTVYVGLLAHWFSRDVKFDQAMPDMKEMAKLVAVK